MAAVVLLTAVILLAAIILMTIVVLLAAIILTIAVVVAITVILAAIVVLLAAIVLTVAIVLAVTVILAAVVVLLAAIILTIALILLTAIGRGGLAPGGRRHGTRPVGLALVQLLAHGLVVGLADRLVAGGRLLGLDVVVPVVDELGQGLVDMGIVVIPGGLLQGGLVGIGLHRIQVGLRIGIDLAGKFHLLKDGLDGAGVALPEGFGLDGLYAVEVGIGLELDIGVALAALLVLESMGALVKNGVQHVPVGGGGIDGGDDVVALFILVRKTELPAFQHVQVEVQVVALLVTPGVAILKGAYHGNGRDLDGRMSGFGRVAVLHLLAGGKPLIGAQTVPGVGGEQSVQLDTAQLGVAGGKRRGAGCHDKPSLSTEDPQPADLRVLQKPIHQGQRLKVAAAFAHALDHDDRKLPRTEVPGLAGVQIGPQQRVQPVVHRAAVLLGTLRNDRGIPPGVIPGDQVPQLLYAHRRKHGISLLSQRSGLPGLSQISCGPPPGAVRLHRRAPRSPA